MEIKSAKFAPAELPYNILKQLSAQQRAQAENTWCDQRWRLNNLYYIVTAEDDKSEESKRQILRLAWAQKEFYDNMWYRNVVLKARQVYMTTFTQALALDMALFKPDTQIGVIAHTVEDAEAIFHSKIKFMYDNLPDFLKAALPQEKGNTRELVFGNGSRIRVATSLRSGTLDLLHVSEFAKICTQGRKKAEEVIAGSFGCVPQHGIIIIESTAEGPTGDFAKIYWNAVELDKAVRRGYEKRTPLDFKPFFFPSYRHPAYRIDEYEDVKISSKATEYFDLFSEESGIEFTPQYKAWYSRQMNTSGDLIRQEFPNTDVEAFMKRSEGAIFARQMTEAEDDNRVSKLPVMRGAPIDVAFDLGRNDSTAMWFYQTHGGWVNFIRTYEHRFVDVMHYVDILKEYSDKYGYRYGTLYLPHDGSHLHLNDVAGSTRDIFQKYGYRVRIVDRPNRKNVSIDIARRSMSFCRFDVDACDDGIKALKAYAWKWDNVYNVARDVPEHSAASNYADAFQTFAYKFKFPMGDTNRTDREKAKTYSRKASVRQSREINMWNPDTSHIII